MILGKNDVLQFHKPVQGARAYLAVAGGFSLSPWLNSLSTHLKVHAGGYMGKAFQKGDEIPFRGAFIPPGEPGTSPVLPWSADPYWGDHTEEILVLPGNEWDLLDPVSKEKFSEETFIVNPQSDRMGYRLDHAPLELSTPTEMVSSAVSFGTLQLLPGGKLILLMADHQTTGGYPRIGHVITAHHSRLAQLGTGRRIRFRLTTQADAEKRYRQQQQYLQQLENACTFRLEKWFHEGLAKL